jgi:hypothetical protein
VRHIGYAFLLLGLVDKPAVIGADHRGIEGAFEFLCILLFGKIAPETLEEVRERFRRMVEQGRANENDDYIIFRWQS